MEPLFFLVGYYHKTCTAAEFPILFHGLFEAHPAAVITVNIRFCYKKCLVVAAGIQIISNLIAAGIIIYTYILEKVFSGRIGVDENHFLVQLPGQLTVFLIIVAQDNQAFHIPSGSNVHHVLNIFPADEHDIVALHFRFVLDGSHQLPYKGILQGLHSVCLVKANHYPDDPGAMTGQHHRAHMWNVILLFKDCRYFINGFLRNPFRISINYIRYCGSADPSHICNILKTNHRCAAPFPGKWNLPKLKLTAHIVPLFASPDGTGDAIVGVAHFFVHFHLLVQAGEVQAFAAFGLLTGCVVGHDLTGKTLVTVLREHIKAKEHNVFSFWIMKGDVRKKFIAEHFFICCDAV